MLRQYFHLEQFFLSFSVFGCKPTFVEFDLSKNLVRKRGFASKDAETQKELLKVEILPKHLDEEVAKYMVEGFGGVMTKLTKEQADYIGVEEEGPFKPEYYRY